MASLRGGTGLAVAVLAVLTLAVAACSSGSASTPAAGKSSPASAPVAAPSTPAPSPAVTSRQAAIAAYRAFWPAGDRAERTGTAAKARAILAGHATPAYIRFMVHGMARYWRQHQLAHGHMTDHVLTAKVVTGTGGHPAAVVVDCQDASQHELVSAGTGHVIAGSQGP